MAILPTNDLNALQRRLDELEARILGAMEDLARELALNAKAFAERNILENGVGQYSTKLYPAYWLHGKELNQRGTRFLTVRGVDSMTGKQGASLTKRRKKGQTGPAEKYSPLTNWGEFREAQGLQRGHVDLHYSNKMFMGMGVKSVEKVGTFYYGVLGNNTIEGQEKMNWNRERYGDYIEGALGDLGKNFLTQLARSRVLTIMQNFQI